MVIVSVFYPQTQETSFDMDYYVDSHLPLVQRLLEPMGMRQSTVLRGMSSGSGGTPAFGVIAELSFDDVESMTAALAAHGPETQADIPNFTDSVPIIQISEVLSS